MTEDTLDSYIRQYIQSQRTPEVTITWQGGEPTLMGLDFFRKSVEYAEKYKKPGMAIQYTMQTNGTLLDHNWCNFFRENNFLIGLSLDGPKRMHDAYRVDKGGNPTFDKVMRGLHLMQDHGVKFNILACVHAANASYPLEVYRFFRDTIGAEFIQFIPIVERDNETGFQEGNEVTDRSVGPEQYGGFLISIFNEWVRHDVGRVYVQIFDTSLAAWVGEPSSLCIFSPTCGNALALEHNGDLYSCDHFVEPRFLLGNINERPLVDLITTDKQRRFGLDKLNTLPMYCRECTVRFACHGGCPKNRFIETPGGEPGLNYLCASYKTFFQYIDKPMSTMASLLRHNRAPAEIMQILSTEDKYKAY